MQSYMNIATAMRDMLPNDAAQHTAGKPEEAEWTQCRGQWRYSFAARARERRLRPTI